MRCNNDFRGTPLSKWENQNSRQVSPSRFVVVVSKNWECERLELLTVTDDTVEQFSADIPKLMWSTGPVSYEYHFGSRGLFDAVALGSWRHRGSLFGFDAATVAVKDGRLMGVEIGINGAEYRSAKLRLDRYGETDR